MAQQGSIIDVKISGIDEVVDSLDAIAQDLKNKLFRQAIDAGAEFMAENVRRQITSMGLIGRGRKKKGGVPLYRSISVIKRSNIKSQGEISDKISSSAWYARLVEYGHRIVKRKPRRTGKKYDTGKRARPYPFMRSALDTSGDAAIRIATDVLKSGFPAIAKKNAARQAKGGS